MVEDQGKRHGRFSTIRELVVSLKDDLCKLQSDL